MTPTLPDEPHATDPIGRGLSLAAAIGVAAGGLLHLQIWNDSKRDIPAQVPGVWVVQEGFLLNVAASLVVAVALVVLTFRPEPRLRLLALVGAIAVEAGSIAALVLSRGPGIFGWSEKGWDADAKQVLIVEIVALLLAVAALARTRFGAGRTAG